MIRIVLHKQRNCPIFEPAAVVRNMELLPRPHIRPCRNTTAGQIPLGKHNGNAVHDFIARNGNMSRILPGRPKQIEFGTAGLSVLRNIATGHGIHDLQDDRTHRRLRRTVIPILTDTPRQQEEQYTASKQQLYDMYRPVHDRILLQSMPQTLRQELPQQFLPDYGCGFSALLPFYILNQIRRPLLRFDGNGQRSRVGRYFGIVAAAAQPLECHIHHIHAVAADKGSVAGGTVATHRIVNTERKIDRLAVIGSRQSYQRGIAVAVIARQYVK